MDCTQDMRVVNEEIFGSVLTVQTFTDESEAVRLANATGYGLAWLREYTVLKQINLAMTTERSGWFADVEDESKGGERLGE